MTAQIALDRAEATQGVQGSSHAHGLDQIIDKAGRDALHIGLLHRGGERLLGHPARLQQFDRASARFPDPVTVAVALTT